MSDLSKAVRVSLGRAFADWWTDFEDDHSPGYTSRSIGFFIEHLGQQGYEIVKRGEVPSWMEHEYDADVTWVEGDEIKVDNVPLYRIKPS